MAAISETAFLREFFQKGQIENRPGLIQASSQTGDKLLSLPMMD